MTDTDRATDMISFRMDDDLAHHLDRIAQQDGLSRSELLRQLLLWRVDSAFPPTTFCIRQLWTVHGQLQDIVDALNNDDEDKAADSVQDAVDSIADSLEELGEEFADEEDDE